MLRSALSYASVRRSALVARSNELTFSRHFGKSASLTLRRLRVAAIRYLQLRFINLFSGNHDDTIII
jgi:hypothetical protein